MSATPTVGCWPGVTLPPVPVILAPLSSPVPVTVNARPSTFRTARLLPGASGRNTMLKLREPPGGSGNGSVGRPTGTKADPLDPIVLNVVLTELVLLI